MTLFEDLAIAFGLLFSVAALRLIGGLPTRSTDTGVVAEGLTTVEEVLRVASA